MWHQTGRMGWPELYDLALHGYVDLALARPAELTRDQVHGVQSAFPTRPQVLLPHESRSRPTDHTADVRRTRRLLTAHLDEVEGIPTVVVARALADLAAELHTTPLRSLAVAAERDRLMAPGQLAEVLDALPRNWPGRARLRQVVEDLTADGSESGFEYTARTRFREEGLRPDAEQPVVLVRGRRRRIDIAWSALRVGVECQGYRAHVGPAALDRDAGRMNALVAEGDWLILQLTRSILHEGWEDFVADLRRCLLRRAAQGGIPVPPGVAAA